ncbi:hypothetical protein [Alishewanella sp. HH-ZS]|uniref:hypothetical protein n=1 Tax=Alishewanella sp. HH-ZS TaxID=1856684 RepID=UPI0008235EE5|nr:hypothetical protein [Alishewanella sp. HH-ZS]OCW96279.1 hypothetical protein A9165_12320 [Alishewanella sp. HH-ZS]
MQGLNGWQRIYIVIVVSWLSYLAYIAYSQFTVAESSIAELQATVERYQKAQQDTIVSDDGGVFEQILVGSPLSPEQWLAHYQAQLTQVTEAKRQNLIFILVLATLPPLLIYLILSWIVAGFRQHKPRAS